MALRRLWIPPPVQIILAALLLIGAAVALGWPVAVAALAASLVLYFRQLNRRQRTLAEGEWRYVAALTYQVAGGPSKLERHQTAVRRILSRREFGAEWIAFEFWLPVAYVRKVLSVVGGDEGSGSTGVPAVPPISPRVRTGRA